MPVTLFLMRFAGKHFDVRTSTEIAYIWCANLLSGVGWPSLLMSPLRRCPQKHNLAISSRDPDCVSRHKFGSGRILAYVNLQVRASDTISEE